MNAPDPEFFTLCFEELAIARQKYISDERFWTTYGKATTPMGSGLLGAAQRRLQIKAFHVEQSARTPAGNGEVLS